MWLYTYHIKECKLYRFILTTKGHSHTMIWYELGERGLEIELNNYKRNLSRWIEYSEEWTITQLEDNDVFFLEIL